MSTKVQELPEVGEIVVATIAKVSDHGAYVTLDEYSGIQGFLHISEIAPGWVRNVTKYVKIGEKKVLLVKKVIPERSEIDLSLKQISKDQQKKKLLEIKRQEKEKTILKTVQEKADLSTTELEELEKILYSKFDSVYDVFLEISMKGIGILDELKLPKKTIAVIEEVSSKIKLPSVEIRGILELTNTKPDGVQIIQKILLDVLKNEGDSVEILYIGAPKYRLIITAQDFKTAEKKLKPILDVIQSSIEKQRGTFKFTREESKKTREG
jgi:translation initiation factor 2 subunit 1